MNEIVEEEAWRYTFDEDGNMVERRCRTTLLAQTEGDESPLPASNEVNPRTELAQASRAFPGKDQVHSVETIFFPNTFTNQIQYDSTSGMSGNRNNFTPFGFQSREYGYRHLLFMCIRYALHDTASFLSFDKKFHEFAEYHAVDDLQILARRSGYSFLNQSPLIMVNSWGHGATMSIRKISGLREWEVGIRRLGVRCIWVDRTEYS